MRGRPVGVARVLLPKATQAGEAEGGNGAALLPLPLLLLLGGGGCFWGVECVREGVALIYIYVFM